MGLWRVLVVDDGPLLFKMKQDINRTICKIELVVCVGLWKILVVEYGPLLFGL